MDGTTEEANRPDVSNDAQDEMVTIREMVEIIWDEARGDRVRQEFVEAPATMAVARRRMQSLRRALSEAGFADDGAWTTGWMRVEGMREDGRRRQWVFRNPNYRYGPPVDTVLQALALIRESQPRGASDTARHLSEMENTLRLNRKRIQHLEDVVVATTQQCHRFQESLKLEEQRCAILKRRFAEACVGSASNDELKAAEYNCRTRIFEIESELERRWLMEEDESQKGSSSSCYICEANTATEGAKRECRSCKNAWCAECETQLERCPYCREPIRPVAPASS